jgi:hypothetical protein
MKTQRVKCIERYRGPFGHFTQGECYDLHPHLAKQLPKSHFQVGKGVTESPNDKQTRPDKPGSTVQTK